MKLSFLSAAAVLLAPALASAQQITIEDDGTLRVNRAQQGGYVGITASGSLCTDYNSNNGFAGNMFDIEPVLDMQISGIDVNVDGTGQQVDVDVWYIPGTSFGNESSSTGWTLIGSFTGTSAGANQPSYIDMSGNGVTFAAGNSYGIYVDVTSYSSGTSVNYTNGDTQGTASGNDEWSNADLKIIANCGKGDGGHTGSTFYPRNWNGCIYYETGGFNLQITSLAAGAQATASMTGGAPGSTSIVAYSLRGGGPTTTVFGAVNLSLPIFQLPPVAMDGAGSGSIVANVPANAAGRPVWIQAVNLTGPGSGVLSNSISTTIQ